MSADALSAGPTHVPCRNCGTVLQGPYCHVCGQHGHDPLRSFAHAVEDVFESFWHLDGRVFRTLRDLLVPGRLASAYLDGRRARYLPPLRLFVILTLLTFFVGKLTLHLDPATGSDAATPETDATGPQSEFVEIAAAASAQEVLQRRDEALRKLRDAPTTEVGAWLAPALEEFVRPRIDAAARGRLTALIVEGRASTADLATLEARVAADAEADARVESRVSGSHAAPGTESAEGPPESGPLHRWLVQRGLRLRDNAVLIQREPDTFVRLFLGAVPGALFVLVPLFALCLKLLYVRSGRGYLQHLAVALYSHCLMLLALLAVFVLAGLQGLAGGMEHGIEMISGLILSLGVPTYLLLMQKRVYAQGWAWTLVKYALLGATYTFLLGVAGLYAVVAGLST